MDLPVPVSFAEEWVRAWNNRDLESLLAHYSDDVEFRSLVAAKLASETAGALSGKPNLRAYFKKALATFPGDLGIELRDVYRGVNSIVVLFEARGRKGAEFMEFNADGKIFRASAHGLAA